MVNQPMSRVCDDTAGLPPHPKKSDHGMPDMVAFLQAWVADPLCVAAIAPSGEVLAELITRDITPTCRPILELGPGTGVFTRALLAQGLKAEDLTLVEYGAKFAELLRIRFPTARILQMDAARLNRCGLSDEPQFGAVVSGLPLLAMPTKKKLAILAGAFGLLREDGAFYQFTYGLSCPVSARILERLGLKATCVGRAYLNIPPAAVYRIDRRKASRKLTENVYDSSDDNGSIRNNSQ